MAASERNGMDPIAYLHALADDPEVPLDAGSLHYLGERFGADPDYVGYYRKAGLDLVPDLIDAQLYAKGASPARR